MGHHPGSPLVPRQTESSSRKQKAIAVADIAEKFKEATATVVTEYRGLTVSNLAELRRSLGDGTTYTVAK
ncbi:50S ribosomal protein L10, partial [Mycolicibacterium sp. A43C]